jgi:succinate dehydrogenase/fumarate reductase flavoprotein subunit
VRAVENLAAAVDAGDWKASIEVLKAVGMYGNGTMNAIGEQDPERLLQAQAEAQLDHEGIPRNEHEMLAGLLETTAYRERLKEITTELRRIYLE